ncbi:MAG: D-2-hydroxyacid dehydrogenase [Planctomycetes bacterium]|nr:D-2-hydroxyacid dehydrogenase [Planctomycetota bacterium]
MDSARPKILMCLPVTAAELDKARREFPQFLWVPSEKGRMEPQHADAAIVYGPPRLDLIEGATAVKWVQSTSAGAEKIARSPQFQKGSFALTTAAGMHDSCAEHALALLLALTRQVAWYARFSGEDRHAGKPGEPKPYDHGIWAARKNNPAPRVLSGSTLGVLGLGAIGRRVAAAARALGMRVIGVSYYGRPVAEADETYPIAELDAQLPRFDVLVLVLPSSPETDGLLDAARIAKLPKHALVVNVGRGNAVDQLALLRALTEGRIAGAGLDVFEPEPLPADSPFYTLPNVVITPHVGGNRPDYNERAFEIFVDNLRRYVKGDPLRHEVERGRAY